VSAAFDEAHINKIYLEGNPTTPLEAATKEYVDTTAAGGNGYVHTQSGASASWTVTHSLGTVDVIVQITDGGSPEKVIVPEEIELTNTNTVTITFPSSQTGKARVIKIG